NWINCLKLNRDSVRYKNTVKKLNNVPRFTKHVFFNVIRIKIINCVGIKLTTLYYFGIQHL
ncbi:hypothetical protein IWQ60_009464, partial [Tieghemiomyces parasiticus]